MNGRNAPGDQRTPSGGVPAVETSGATATYGGATPGIAMRAGGVTFSGTATAAVTGGGLPHENRQPFLVLNYCIALQGVFPARN
jgi:microcystin-dependent protein